MDPRISKALQQLAARGTPRRYGRGTVVVHEGDPGGSMWFIEQGLVRVYTARADGQEFTFGYCGPGEWLGELSLDGSPRSASVIVEAALLCRVVSREVIESAVAEHPAIALALLDLVTARARRLSSRAAELALDDAYGRLVRLLHDGSLPQPDGTRLMRESLTQAGIAQQIGCSRTMVTRLLGDLVKGDLLRQENRRWRLLRPLPPRW